MDRCDPTARPAQRPRQLDIQAQRIGGTLQGAGLFHLIDDRFDLVQCAREPRGKTIGEQTEGPMTFRAIPAGNACTGRRDPLIGAVTGKRAATMRMQRTARQGCIPPGLSANVFLAGEPRFKSKLHWPQARTAATVAGHSPSL